MTIENKNFPDDTQMTAVSNKNLQDDTQDSIIQNEDEASTGAGCSTPEDTPDYEKLIERQSSQIDELIEANKSLQSQIGVLLRNGAAINDANENESTQRESERDDYVSLSDLGKELGKREY